jgi:hypothetical protein
MDPTESSTSASHRKILIERLRNFAPRGPILFLFFLFFAALLIARRPDCILHPQFWAEEGTRFFTDARAHPAWANLAACPYGYFDLLIRTAHQIAVLFPIETAPLVLVLIAIAIQAAVPTFVVSSRYTNWMGPFPIRLVAAVLYCAMPNSFEVHCIQLHSRVHLAVLAALLIVSAPSRSLAGKLFDGSVLIVSGLSGPFALILAPVAGWQYWIKRDPATRRNFLILAVALVLEIFALIYSSRSRFGVPIGASFPEAIRIIGGQFAMGFFLGQGTYSTIVHQPYFDVAAGLSLLALLVLVFLFVQRGRPELRQLLFVGVGALAIALAAPIGAPSGMTQWHALWSIPGCGQRYYFVPMAMLLFAIAAAAGRGHARVWQTSATALLVLIATTGGRVDWTLPAFTDFHFSQYANLYRALPPGASITVRINPPGWHMELKKSVSDRR